MEIEEITKLVVDTLNDKKAEDIEVLDVRDRTPLADFYVIATGNNPRLMNALKEAVEEAFEKNKLAINHIEGKPESGWILVDGYSVIINIFSPEERERISLKDLLARPIKK
jgi:ribosome-associated protein